jgi:hypothetical protein
MLEFEFQSTVIHWRGPAPFFYAPLPAEVADEIRRVARSVSYGWGVIPVEAVIGGIAFTTSLFPKDGGYLLPLKDAVRRPAAITAGDTIEIEMTVGRSRD